MKKKNLFLIGAAIAPFIFSSPSIAQTATVPEESEQVRANEIIVTAAIAFRNRTEDTNPVLSYDLEYFQRFEPVSVGEMLKRVPGVTFTSDVLEYDGAQMRGLPPGFTQVLINGRRAPGAGADRSFFVDRIPAELVERIEIVRAPRADQPSEGIAGTLNIITKEAASFEGGFAKAGTLINEDGGVRPSGAIAYADTLGDTSFWAALNYQERRNPKKKISERFDGDLFFDNRELQDDTRDGSDLSANAEITTRIGEGRLRVGGLVVDTDRDEDETSIEYVLRDGLDAEELGERFIPKQSDLVIDGAEVQRERISQQTYAITADLELPVGPGEFGLRSAWNGFRDDTLTEVDQGDTLDELELDERLFQDIKDDEYQATAFYSFKAGSLSAKLGLDYLNKERNGSLLEDGSQDEPVAGALFTIKEKRYDPYARLTFEPSSSITIDAGLRYEITRRKVASNPEEEVGLTDRASYNAESLNPSFHFRFTPTGNDQFRASLARTVRRPNYDYIAPFRQFEEPADENVLVGNPDLKNERAWGVDIGYERRLAGKGIVGVNFFYRDISDLIEVNATGEEIDGFREVTPRNVGDGKTWGVEFDFSTPLAFLGAPDTGIFANYTYLDSETTDPFTGEKRRFNNQPHHIYNAGFIQTVRAVDASFGASISGRSKARESNFDETVDLTYGADLEAFVEKRFGRNFVLRFSAQNLLNRAKRETFDKFDGDSFDEIVANRAAGELDEHELERERAGRLFQVTLRAAF
ncbi:TonB-dependent receptor [Sphingomonas oleivorans]|uniref:TonB-dependent receptor n=1 Tax=Sphingomonas oleivorans TaxID=1735121 RepID=A0A2T5G119_9SPHN|nr:TonB-dependent receptor [Sphingomonas oleivorans]PTQ12856.1 TonB-dependent receptor [Sphingomonas oleivorans]